KIESVRFGEHRITNLPFAAVLEVLLDERRRQPQAHRTHLSAGFASLVVDRVDEAVLAERLAAIDAGSAAAAMPVAAGVAAPRKLERDADAMTDRDDVRLVAIDEGSQHAQRSIVAKPGDAVHRLGEVGSTVGIVRVRTAVSAERHGVELHRARPGEPDRQE